MNYIQGDISLHEIKEIPYGEWEKEQNNILAYGEVTGHQHWLDCSNICVLKNEKGERIIKLEQDTELIHDFKNGTGASTEQEAMEQDKHQKQIIKKGLYMLNIEIEFNPFLQEIKQVVD